MKGVVYIIVFLAAMYALVPLWAWWATRPSHLEVLYFETDD